MAATRAEHADDARVRIALAGSCRQDVFRDLAAVVVHHVHVEHRLLDPVVAGRGRRFIGIELHRGYAAMAQRRLAAAVRFRNRAANSIGVQRATPSRCALAA